MINKYIAMGLGALIALAPLGSSAFAQSSTMAAPAAHTGTHSSRMRHKASEPHHRARASAEHQHKMRTSKHHHSTTHHHSSHKSMAKKPMAAPKS